MAKLIQVAKPQGYESGIVVDNIEVGFQVRWSFDDLHRPGWISGSYDAGVIKVNGVDYKVGGSIRSYVLSGGRQAPVRALNETRRPENGCSATDAARAALRFIEKAIENRVRTFSPEEIAKVAVWSAEQVATYCERQAQKQLDEAAAYRALVPSVISGIEEAINAP
jgi:hypothetical protein